MTALPWQTRSLGSRGDPHRLREHRLKYADHTIQKFL
jgi:hypothetical protein